MDVNRKLKIGVLVGAAIALTLAVGASGAIAIARALDANEQSQAVIDDAADELGVEPSALSEALRNALKNRVDEAVEAGRLTEEQGARLKERIDEGVVPLVGFGRGGPGAGPGRALGHLGKLDAAASYLGLTEAELQQQLRGGKTLAQVARDEGKSVDGLVDALVAEAKEKIAQAVADGRLSQERATELEAGLEERMTDLVNGELRPRGFGPRFGRGFAPFDGPPAFRGKRS